MLHLVFFTTSNFFTMSSLGCIFITFIVYFFSNILLMMYYYCLVMVSPSSSSLLSLTHIILGAVSHCCGRKPTWRPLPSKSYEGFFCCWKVLLILVMDFRYLFKLMCVCVSVWYMWFWIVMRYFRQIDQTSMVWTTYNQYSGLFYSITKLV